MKNVIFGILVVFFALLSCRGGEDDIQKIDQILNIYMKNSSGRDLFHNKKDSSVYTYSMNDNFGDSDTAPVTSSLKMTSDSLFYIEYIAGAKRIGLDTLDPNNKTYHSVITVSLRKSVNNIPIDTIQEKLEIQYRSTPTVFEVSKVYYNDTLRFTKQPNVPNVVTIIK
ncbi:hypothetical protein [Chryseobacterium sp. G0201]|uniref:hypothetical protein n=1 Tax=Chryseobacterium sp. G0201 TaxID=2487065 RepID=UPI000F4F31D0|nr:hypothetical protein [Chryseobacterium sp. G0201]AZA52492.1 hypothetical protein EG348_05495 [Chryseobacterium sp. G0201]